MTVVTVARGDDAMRTRRGPRASRRGRLVMPWQRGGVLLSHVDREETHALSAIINVAQVQGACTLPFCPPARAKNVFCTSPTERRGVSLRGTTFTLTS